MFDVHARALSPDRETQTRAAALERSSCGNHWGAGHGYLPKTNLSKYVQVRRVVFERMCQFHAHRQLIRSQTYLVRRQSEPYGDALAVSLSSQLHAEIASSRPQCLHRSSHIEILSTIFPRHSAACDRKSAW